MNLSSTINRTSSSCITNLPDDCLNLIFKRLTTRKDRYSFGLTCRHWLRIQNNNHKSLWFCYRYDPYPREYPKFSLDDCFSSVLCKLFTRFQNLEALSLTYLPKITDFVMLQSQLSGSNVTLSESGISDRGLEALANCCSSLETVHLTQCCSITDAGISFLLQNCSKLRSLCINSCSSITGIGFLGCPKTLTHIYVGDCNLEPKGIEAIVSGGGLEYLYLSTFMVGRGCINTEAVITISKGCPLLKELSLHYCEDVELQAWEAIGRNCKNLEHLNVFLCRKLCDLGLQALCNGCSKLSTLDICMHSCSRSGLELFKRKRPDVMLK